MACTRGQGLEDIAESDHKPMLESVGLVRCWALMVESRDGKRSSAALLIPGQTIHELDCIAIGPLESVKL